MARPVLTLFLLLALGLTVRPSQAAIDPKAGRDLLSPQVMRSMQAYMLEKRFDGWLFSGQGPFGDLETEFLGLSGRTSHRWFIFYAGVGTIKEPFLIYHPEDEPVFSGLRLYPLPYRSRREMLSLISDKLWTVAKKICLNYSREMSIPELSQADAGMKEWLEKNGFETLSSGTILSFFNTRWRVTDEQEHARAAELDTVLPQAVGFLREKIGRNRRVTDYDLAKQIEKSLKKAGLTPVEPPTVAVGEKTLLARCSPLKSGARTIARGDLLYLEVAARMKDKPDAMHARLGWCLFVGDSVPDSLGADWRRVKSAADSALVLLRSRIPRGKTLCGYEVDEAARAKIGPDPDLLPRPLGLNLNPYGHLFGVRFDSFTARDDREIMPGLGFTLEPGIYREKYALRLCGNLRIDGKRQVVLSAPLQKRIVAVLAPGDPLDGVWDTGQTADTLNAH
jgi:Xaa-Pro dipeptidase